MMVHRTNVQSGFSLIELVFVMLILGILAGVGIPAFNMYRDRARKSATVSSLTSIQQAIDVYNSDSGSYPRTLQDLVEKPSGDEGKNWQHQYLKKLPVDGWKHEFYYKVTKGGKHPYELYSYGADEEDAEGQISAWDI